MALEIAVSPSLPAQGVVRGAERGGLRGAGAWRGTPGGMWTGRRPAWGDVSPPFGALVKSDAFKYVF